MATESVLQNPATYTKLSCFLPWIAKEYNMEFEDSQDVKEECVQSAGDPLHGENETCKSITVNPINLIDL